MAMMHGNELGLPPVVALQSIAVINGKPSVWGDAALAVVKAHPDFEDIIEEFETEKRTAKCSITRKGQTPVVRTFSWRQAELAKLTTKDVYQKYPERMLQMRARSLAMRDSFPDALKGIGIREETQDYDSVEIEPKQAEDQETVDPNQALRDELLEILNDAHKKKNIISEGEKNTVTFRSKQYQTEQALKVYIEKIKTWIEEKKSEQPVEVNLEPAQEDPFSEDVDKIFEEK